MPCEADERLFLCDIPIDPMTPDKLTQCLVQWSGDKTPRHVSYVNAHVHNLARRNEPLREALVQSDLCYADGASIVWACRRHGARVPLRLTAADFLPDVCHELAKAGRRVFLLGGADGIAQRAADELSAQIPGFHPAGVHHGYFELEQSPLIVQLIRASQPDLLIVGMGTPRQETWAHAHQQQLGVPVIWTVGALLDYFAGIERRCPSWVGNAGFEWAYRLMMQPRRMAGRYLIGNAQFVAATLRGKLRHADHELAREGDPPRAAKTVS